MSVATSTSIVPVPVPVSASDLPTLGDFLYSSKLTLTINRLLFKDWPNEAVQKPIYTSAVEAGFHDPSVECLKVVDDESREIVGYLALTRRRATANTERPPDAGDGMGRQNGPEGFEPAVLSAVSTAVTEIAKEMEGVDYFELTYICVKPSNRKQGVGSRLVQVCFDKAEAEGVPLAVCSEPAAHDFFAKLGFKDTRHVNIDLSKWAPAYSGFGIFRLAGMVWSP